MIVVGQTNGDVESFIDAGTLERDLNPGRGQSFADRPPSGYLAFKSSPYTV